MKRRRRVALAGEGLAIVLTVALLVLRIVDARTSQDPTPVFAIGGLAYASIGMLIVARTGNAIGWLLWITSLGILVPSLTDEYGFRAFVIAPGSLPAARVIAALTPLFALGLAAIGMIFLLFPTGRPPSGRWRPVGWAIAGGAVMAGLGFALRPGPLNGPWNDPGIGVRIDNPLGLQLAAPLRAIWAVGVGLVLIGSALAIASLVVRYRRSSGEERVQLRWLVYVGGLAITLFPTMALLPVPEDLAWGLFVADLAIGIPAACAIAIFRYHLYDIDVVISKTIVFGALAIFIGAVYVGVVVGFGELVGAETSSVALQVAATALIAISFEPVRVRFRRWANRLVYGRRATPYEVMADFGHRMAQTPSADELLRDMAAAAATGVGASKARVRLFLESGERAVTSPAGAALGVPTLSIPVVHAGGTIGELAVMKPANEPLRPAERSLLDDLASHAGFALHNARLAADLETRAGELASQTQELDRSRSRIVTARDAQRRRLERELRDGVAAELGAIRDEIEADARRLPTEPARVQASLDGLGERANAALEDLRDVARGIFPPLLADRGLATALEAHVRKLGLDASIRIAPGVADARFDPATENAVYFCCIQALQNAQRHATGTRIEVRLDLAEGELTFVVRDWGVGFEPSVVIEGEGMQIMRDRVAALDGTLEIESAPRRGTTVTGRVPANRPEWLLT